MAHILIAEDEEMLYKLVSFRLQQLGHRVTWAHHGGMVVDLVLEDAPDLILLDVMMPVMDGFEVLHTLKSDPRTRAIPVMMLTARSNEKDMAAGLSGGAEDYVIKPFNFHELVNRVNAVLLRHQRFA